jgi:hypothetical protein
MANENRHGQHVRAKGDLFNKKKKYVAPACRTHSGREERALGWP